MNKLTKLKRTFHCEVNPAVSTHYNKTWRLKRLVHKAISLMLVFAITLGLVVQTEPTPFVSEVSANVTSITSSGVYYIQNKSSGLMMDVEGGILGATNRRLIQHSFNGGHAQRFEVVEAGRQNGEAFYEIVPQSNPTNRLQVMGTPNEIRTQAPNSNNSQRYFIRQNTNGSFRIVPLSNTAHVIEAVNNSQGALQTATHSATQTRQQWDFHLIPDTLEDGLYYLQNRGSGHYADAEWGHSASGTRIIQHAYHGGFNQLWEVARVGLQNGLPTYRIVPQHATGTRWHIEGTGVQIRTTNNANTQLFHIRPNHNSGSYRIIPVSNTSQVVEVPNNSQYSALRTATFSLGNALQEWDLMPYGDSMWSRFDYNVSWIGSPGNNPTYVYPETKRLRSGEQISFFFIVAATNPDFDVDVVNLSNGSVTWVGRIRANNQQSSFTFRAPTTTPIAEYRIRIQNNNSTSFWSLTGHFQVRTDPVTMHFITCPTFRNDMGTFNSELTKNIVAHPFTHTFGLRYLHRVTNLNNTPLSHCSDHNNVDVGCSCTPNDSDCTNNPDDPYHHSSGGKNIEFAMTQITPGRELSTLLVSSPLCRSGAPHMGGVSGLARPWSHWTINNYSSTSSPILRIRIVQHENSHLYDVNQCDTKLLDPCVMDPSGITRPIPLTARDVWCSSCRTTLRANKYKY